MIGAIANLGTAALQMYQAFQAKKNAGDRPTMETPEALTEMMRNSKLQANQGLPGVDLMKDNVYSNTANTNAQLQQMGNGAAGMGAILQANQNGQNQINNLSVQDAQQRLANQGQYRSALSQMAGEQRKQFDYNQNQPYQEGMNDYANLLNAGIGNAGNAAQGADNILGALATSKGWGTDGMGGFWASLNGNNNQRGSGTNFSAEEEAWLQQLGSRPK